MKEKLKIIRSVYRYEKKHKKLRLFQRILTTLAAVFKMYSKHLAQCFISLRGLAIYIYVTLLIYGNQFI